MDALLYLSVLACVCAAPQFQQQETNISVHGVSSSHIVSSQNNMVSSQHGVIQSSSYVHETHVEESSNNFFSTRSNYFFSTSGHSDEFNFNIGDIRKRKEETMRHSWPTQVVMELNGFEEQDISVTIRPGLLKVVADRGGNHYESTRSISPFVEPDNSSYKFKNGVLTITFQLEGNETTQKPDLEELESREEESVDPDIDIETHGTTQNPEQEKEGSNEDKDSDFDEKKDVELIN